ncbi:MAG: hypothetical protein NUV45_09575 [Tepidanaerobacteraceae bacterium]|jgi:spore germination protein YaaH|nr:hypothetical protein [Tepidanaerobacteraceae bacterium]
MMNRLRNQLFLYHQRSAHIVWFEDARSFSAKLVVVNEYNLGGIAVWRLGQEDQRVWSIIAYL